MSCAVSVCEWRAAPQRNQTIKKVREKSNNQNPTNTTFPSHSFSVIKIIKTPGKSRENEKAYKRKTLGPTRGSHSVLAQLPLGASEVPLGASRAWDLRALQGPSGRASGTFTARLAPPPSRDKRDYESVGPETQSALNYYTADYTLMPARGANNLFLFSRGS